MLIIAIPKSASSSLHATMCRLHDMDGTQLTRQPLEVPEGVSYIQNIHSDVKEYTPEYGARFGSNDMFYKQHVPPTENNRALLKDHKKVLLLRDPDEIMEAYFRAKSKDLFSPPEPLASINELADWKAKTAEIGLHQDMVNFVELWSAEPNTLIIQYRELMADPKATINKMENYWGLKLSEGNVELVKARYSRAGGDADTSGQQSSWKDSLKKAPLIGPILTSIYRLVK